jgi:hypothetical protein
MFRSLHVAKTEICFQVTIVLVEECAQTCEGGRRVGCMLVARTVEQRGLGHLAEVSPVSSWSRDDYVTQHDITSSA